ncbi:unnamed protein product [Toxocara canis]|uniref:Uncharacterized protein n=1 Tax=Toxocara canis TaxID=6265 RepID=A0A183VCI3_TOXCA|nr:unnamed protein product [Toxocara canis]
MASTTSLAISTLSEDYSLATVPPKLSPVTTVLSSPPMTSSSSAPPKESVTYSFRPLPPSIQRAGGKTRQYALNAMLKLRREETVPDIMDTFLGKYRTTPNASLLEQRTLAELFLDRSPCTSLDLLKPPPVRSPERESKMEQQFKRHHGGRSRQFDIGDTIYARHRQGQNWRPGTIKE